jgi:hypothetical protein
VLSFGTGWVSAGVKIATGVGYLPVSRVEDAGSRR